jgi:hypothetical protein
VGTGVATGVAVGDGDAVGTLGGLRVDLGLGREVCVGVGLADSIDDAVGETVGPAS